MTLFVYIFAILITAPIVTLIIFYWLFKGIFKDDKKALHWTVDVTTLFSILSVDVVMHAIWHRHFFGSIILVFLITAFFFCAIYLFQRQEIHFRSLLKGIWRSNFLVFMSSYIFLIAYGLVSGVIHQV